MHYSGSTIYRDDSEVWYGWHDTNTNLLARTVYYGESDAL